LTNLVVISNIFSGSPSIFYTISCSLWIDIVSFLTS
jgi:hypothetical protein